MNQFDIREARPEDYPGILALNELEVPHVNSIDLEELKHLHEQSISFGVAFVSGHPSIGAHSSGHPSNEDHQQPAAFLLALDESANYKSLNFQWFFKAYRDFTYVDRIVVSSSFRRMGLAQALYAHLIDKIPAKCPVLNCEVNLEPANPGSIAFHNSMGFVAVGEQDTDAGQKRVCLMSKGLHAQG